MRTKCLVFSVVSTWTTLAASFRFRHEFAEPRSHNSLIAYFPHNLWLAIIAKWRAIHWARNGLLRCVFQVFHCIVRNAEYGWAVSRELERDFAWVYDKMCEWGWGRRATSGFRVLYIRREMCRVHSGLALLCPNKQSINTNGGFFCPTRFR